MIVLDFHMKFKEAGSCFSLSCASLIGFCKTPGEIFLFWTSLCSGKLIFILSAPQWTHPLLVVPNIKPLGEWPQKSSAIDCQGRNYLASILALHWHVKELATPQVVGWINSVFCGFLCQCWLVRGWWRWLIHICSFSRRLHIYLPISLPSFVNVFRNLLSLRSLPFCQTWWKYSHLLGKVKV